MAMPIETGLMLPRWNAGTHLQSVQFDYEREPKMRQVRLCSATPVAGEFARIAMSGVEIEVIVSAVPGLLTVKVKRTRQRLPQASEIRNGSDRHSGGSQRLRPDRFDTLRELCTFSPCPMLVPIRTA